jgi:hypothetical protein
MHFSIGDNFRRRRTWLAGSETYLVPAAPIRYEPQSGSAGKHNAHAKTSVVGARDVDADAVTTSDRR